MSKKSPAPESWDFNMFWACEAKIDWDQEIEIKPEGRPIPRNKRGFITKMTIKPINRGKIQILT